MLRMLVSLLLIWLSFAKPTFSFGAGNSNSGSQNGNTGSNEAETSSIDILGNQPNGYDRFCLQTRLTAASRFQVYTSGGLVTVYCLFNVLEVDRMVFHHLYGSEILTNEPALIGARNKSVSFLRRDSFVSMCLLSCSQGVPYPRFHYLVGNEIEEPANLNVGCDDVTNMKCKEKCPSINIEVENGVVMCTAGEFDGSVCKLRCNIGFIARGVSEKKCNAERSSWLPDTPYVCEATCSLSLFAVENGRVTCNDSTFVGSMCTLECNSGYRPVGNTEKRCDTSQSVWVPAEDFQCEASVQLAVCTVLPPATNGEVECSKNNSVFSHCTLTCRNGFYPTEPVVHWCFPNDVGGGHSWHLLTQENVPKRAVIEESMTCTEILTQNRTREIQRAVLENNNYNAQLKRFSYCRMPIEDRTPCRIHHPTREVCVERGCCWNEENNYPSRCFRSIRTPINPYWKSPRGSSRDRNRQPVAVNPNEPSRLTSAILAAAAVHYVGVSRPNSLSWSQQANSDSSIKTCGCKEQAGVSERCTVIDGIRRNLQLGKPKKTLGITKKICGGVRTDSGKWPWHAVVYFRGQLCGGTLVAPQYVITAAHCLPPASGALDHLPGQKLVALGATNLSNNADPHLQIRNIQTIVRHPNYTDANGYATNDIAILKLDHPVTVDGYYVRPLCLPENRRPLSTDDCFVTGFGKDDSISTGSTTILRVARVPLVARYKCQQYYPGHRLTDTNICAGSTTPGTADTCKGDSGGALTCRRRSSRNTPCNYYFAGITSFGRAPCGQGTSGVYTNVYVFQTWIRETVWILSHHF